MEACLARQAPRSRIRRRRKMNQHEHRGSCHCGNLRWTLHSALSLAQLPVRTCGCRFCRKHGLLTTSDPQGEMEFIVTNPAAVLRAADGLFA